MPGTHPAQPRFSRQAGSALLGLVVFVAGIAMIALAFKLAYDVFNVPPEVRLKINPEQPIDAGEAASTILQVVVKVLMLVVMAGFGSMVANRGIKLYSAGGGKAPMAKPKPKTSTTEPDSSSRAESV